MIYNTNSDNIEVDTKGEIKMKTTEEAYKIMNNIDDNLGYVEQDLVTISHLVVGEENSEKQEIVQEMLRNVMELYTLKNRFKGE